MVLLIASLYFLLQNANVQTYLTHSIATHMSKMLNAKVSVERVNIEFFKTIVLSGVYVEDQQGDTLLYAGALKGDVESFSVKHQFVDINLLELENTDFYLRKYRGKESLNLQFILDKLKSQDTTASTASWTITCEQVNLNNIHFKYRDHNQVPIKFGVDFNDIEVNGLFASISNVKLKGDTILSKVEGLSLKEKSGFVVKNLATSLLIDSQRMIYRDLVIKTAGSEIKIELFFKHGDFANYSDFIEKVHMNSLIRGAVLEMEDLSYFAPELQGIKKRLVVSGDVKGTVSKLKGKNLNIQFGSDSYFRGDMDMTGLPEITETFILLDIQKISTNKYDLEKIPIPPFNQGKKLFMPELLERLGNLEFTGSFTGFINDFVAYGEFNTALGKVVTDMNLSSDSASGTIGYTGKVAANNFQIGRLSGNEADIGAISTNLIVEGHGFKKNNFWAKVNGDIKRFDFRAYKYGNIRVAGEITKDKFKGNLAVKDPNVDLLFKGSIDFTKSLPLFKFTSSIKNAQLAKLNLVERDSSASFSSQLSINFTGNNLDNAEGFIRAENIRYFEKDKEVQLNSLGISASGNDTLRVLNINSDVVNGGITGKFNTLDLPATLQYLIAGILPSYFKKDKISPANPQLFSFDVKANNLGDISKIFLPDIDLPGKLTARGKLSTAEESFSAVVDAGGFSWKDKTFENIQLDIAAIKGILNIDGTIQHLSLNDSIWLDNVGLMAKALDDNLQFGLYWKNQDTLDYSGNISGLAQLYSREKFNVNLLSSWIAVADTVWEINKENNIFVDSTSVNVDNLVISNDNQSLSIDGKLSELEGDNLSMKLSDFDLRNVNFLIKDQGITLDGKIDGNAIISGLYSGLKFSSDMEIEGLKVNEVRIGNGSLFSGWNNVRKAVEMKGRFDIESVNTLSLDGDYFPGKKQNQLDITASVSDLQLKIIEPFANDLVSEIEGTVSGPLFIRGSLEKPHLSGELRLQNAGFLVNYLNTRYKINNEVLNIEKDWLYFDRILIQDEKGEKAFATGTIIHNNFKDFNFDISIDAKKFTGLNTDQFQNSLYYGNAVLTGLINISGYPENLQMEINARTEKGTKFFIPLSGSEEISEHGFISFVNHDTTAQTTEDDYKVDLSGIQMDFELDVTPDAEVQIIFDETVGDIITARGNSNLKLNINTLGNFNIYGEYEIVEGDYLFTLENIINKKFIIEKGGSITWNGDPYTAELNIDAVYKLRTSLNQLTGDSVKNRVPVDVHLLMSDQLQNPDISFDIELPYTDDVTRSAVNDIIQRDINKQVFSLLLINQFQRETGLMEGISGKSVTATTSTEMLSHQLSNWLSQFSKDFDIGVNYRKGNEGNPGEAEVALSTQLLNDRLTLSGNVGYTENGSENQESGSSGVIGDAVVEYKISKDGKLRAKAFYEANENNAITDDEGGYTHGVGVFYREEFDTFGEFFRKLFNGNKKKKKKNKE